MKTLLPTPRNIEKRFLVTGAGGYVGMLSVAALLHAGAAAVVIPLRSLSRQAEIRSSIELELSALGSQADAVDRLEWVEWPEVADATADRLASLLTEARVDEIVHCAGCVDYYDEAALQAVNQDYTRLLSLAALSAGVQRLTYVSTSYAGGYRQDAIAECLLDEPPDDPTPYTRSKRIAEHELAASQVPWLILRPSILIGDTATGRYSGKRYGLYQQWMGLERLMTSKYHAEIHTVAPEAPLNLLHQDAWQRSLLACLRFVPDYSVVNIVSNEESAPSMRELWRMWAAVVQPERILIYPRFEDVDLKAIDMRQRAYLTFAQVNLEIGSHHWCFERGWMNALEAAGHLSFNHATVDTVQRCQDRFVAASNTLEQFRLRHAARLAANTHLVFLGTDNGETNETLRSLC